MAGRALTGSVLMLVFSSAIGTRFGTGKAAQTGEVQGAPPAASGIERQAPRPGQPPAIAVIGSLSRNFAGSNIRSLAVSGEWRDPDLAVTERLKGLVSCRIGVRAELFSPIAAASERVFQRGEPHVVFAWYLAVRSARRKQPFATPFSCCTDRAKKLDIFPA